MTVQTATSRTTAADARNGHRLRGWAYASPTALFVLVLFVVPLALVFRMSASKWPLLSGDQGINFPDNFTAAVDNRFFVDSVVFTLKYTILATILLIALGLGLALMVQESSRWKGLLRTSFLVPSALGLASASLLFYVLYSPLAGPLAPFMERMGWSFLGSPDAALASTLFLIVWRYAGFYMLLMLVGLQAIPGDIYEAARMDGASRWHTFSQDHDPAAQAHPRADHDPVRHGVAAGVRAVLHPHQGRPGQQHHHRGPAHLLGRVPGPERPGRRRGALRDRPGRARGHQRRPAPRLPRLGRELRGRR